MEDIPPTEQFLRDYRLQGQMLPVHTYPDPVLKKVASPVTSFDGELKTLATNMLHTLYHHPCPAIGLAAPQVGQSLRMFVIDVDYERKEQETGEVVLENLNPRLFINPIFKDKKGETTYPRGMPQCAGNL